MTHILRIDEMAMKTSSRVVYKEQGVGKIDFVTDYKFGDNHYVICDKDGNCLGKIPQRMMGILKFGELLLLYVNGGDIYNTIRNTK